MKLDEDFEIKFQYVKFPIFELSRNFPTIYLSLLQDSNRNNSKSLDMEEIYHYLKMSNT